MAVIERLSEEDERFGVFGDLPRFRQVSRTKPVTHILLNEHQAISVTIDSRVKSRHALRNSILDVFLSVKRGDVQPANNNGWMEASESRADPRARPTVAPST